MTRWKIVVGAGVGALVVAAGIGASVLEHTIAIPLPSVPPVQRSVWLDQNWSDAQRGFFHHAQQGATTFGIPYEWMKALERPELALGAPGMMTDAAYLDRYGFIASDSALSDLPIGFEHGDVMFNPTTGKSWTNPQTGKPLGSVGLSCAACHTGRMTYRGTEIYVDGGPSKIDVNAVRKAMSVALYMTRYVPGRFDRFAARILGPEPRPDAKATLLGELDAFLDGVAKVRKLDDAIADRSVPEGIGRLDALNRIGNQVFGLGLSIDANYWPTSAPVRYPQIWGASRFDWVEWNGSIEQPMVRNAGEALGLGTKIDLTRRPKPTFASNLKLDTIYAIEASLRGPQEGTAASGASGLRAPKWPEDILPKIDRAAAARGATLYAELCQSCHLPPVDSPAFYDPKLRQPAPPHALRVMNVPVATIGTDPAQAEDMAKRTVEVPAALGLTSAAYGPALAQLVEKAVDTWYDSQIPPTPSDRRREMNGDLPNGVRTPIAYKARPLDGVWSVAPYLHNGSVPTLYALLSPVAERPKDFTIGSREFDPVDVGLRTDPIDGGTRIDTSKRGDLNTGHAFDDPGPGVIGRRLSVPERRDLVEYLKTL